MIGCDGDFYRTRYGSISFRNCFFREIKRNFFEIFVNLHTFNISDVGLEILQLKTFRNAGNLTTLLASNNNLTELTAHLFLDAENLTSVDFSYNKIYRVDPLVFHDVKALRTVNLSHNSIEKLDWNSLSSSSLVTVDLSHNNLTSLNGPIFGYNLKHLSLSFNPIGNLNIDTLAYLQNLEYLNLKHTNISVIQLGTLSHQHKLVSLDLSETKIKEFDFNIFLPIMHDLRSLFLGENQLKELKGFRNGIFPQLVLLDIKNNPFNCSYLQKFMETVNWEKLHLHIDPISINTRQTNIRGINCENADNKTIDEELDRSVQKNESNKNSTLMKSIENHQYTSMTGHESNNDIFIVKIASIFICIVMLIFLIVFLVLNQHRFFKRPTTYYKPSDQVVEFLNEELYIKETSNSADDKAF